MTEPAGSFGTVVLPRPGLYLNGATIMTTATDQQIEIAREAGYAGVEVRAERLLDDEAERRRASDLVRLGEVWSLNGVQIPLDAEGRLDHRAFERELDRRLDVCVALRSSYLLVVPPRVAGLDAKRAMPALHEALTTAGIKGSEAQGVSVAFEFLGFWDCPVRTPAAAGELVEGLEGLVDLVLDSCHWHASGAGSLDGFPVERLAMVHLNDAPAREPARIEDADRLLPGDGVIQLPQLLAELRERGYQGPFSLETFNPEHWAADPRAIAMRGREALARLLEPAGFPMGSAA